MPRPRRAHTIGQKSMQYYQNENPDIFYTEDQLPSEHAQCRICLQGKLDGNKLIGPCKCTGSVQFIHEECMRQWIEKCLNKKISTIRCQLCKQPIIYSIKSQRQCNKCELIRQKLSTNYKIFLFLLFLLLINIGVTVYLIIIFVHVIEISSGNPKFIEIGVISFSIVLLIVISSILMGIMIREFVYSECRRVGEIANFVGKGRKLSHNLSFQTRPGISKAKIHPLAITEVEQIP